MSNRQPEGSLRNVRLVASREFLTRVTSRTFVVATLAAAALLVVAMVVVRIVGDSGDEPLRVGVHSDVSISDTVQSAADAEQVDVEIVPFDGDGSAALADNDLDAAVMSFQGGMMEVVTADELGAAVTGILERAARTASVTDAAAAAGVDPGDFLDALNGNVLQVTAVDPPDDQKGERRALASIASFLLFFAIYMAGIYVAIGVVEEKANALVESVLAAIRPRELLAGKVIGIGAVGLLQLAFQGAVGLAAAHFTDAVSLPSMAWGLFLSVLVWYVIGFGFYAVLFAACGALVSRQEDVTSATTPVNVLALLTFFVAQPVIADPNSSLAATLAWLPGFSPIVVPVLQATGDIDAVTWIGSLVVMVVTTLAAAAVAERVYRRSVLHRGSPLKLSRVLRASHDPQ
jgi:ABC-2 type transport system permease protein